MPKKQVDTQSIDEAMSVALETSLDKFNADNGKSWTFGTNWDATGSTFETYINKYLFPKLNETAIINVALGNRFNWLAQEQDFIGQYSEEYVILDTVPIELDLTKDATLMLERNYPKIATKLYGSGILKKLKFTLNDNIQRQSFATLGDATAFAVNVYKKKLSDINVEEERELKSMIVDYVKNYATDKRTTTQDGLIDTVYTALLNLQNNSEKHNEASTASGGAIGRYTTQSKLDDLLIITSDQQKVKILNSFIATTFNSAGLDITDHIISFEDLGGSYRLKNDLTLAGSTNHTKLIEAMRTMGDYQVSVGDTLKAGTIFTYDVNALTGVTFNEFEEVTAGNNDVIIIDTKAIRYKRYTRDMLKKPFYNGEFDEVTYWIHYYSMKAISPFYNKVYISVTE